MIPFIPDNAPFSSEQRAWLNGFLAGLFSTADPNPTEIASLGLKVSVLFATQSGTSERLAKKLVKELKAKGHFPDIASLDSYTTTALADQELALIIASTYGEGEPPDGATSFFESLSLPSAPRLDHLRFSVFALGDTSYEHFCKFGIDLDNRLYALGATRLSDRVESGVEPDILFEQWKTSVFAALCAPSKETTSSTSLSAPAELPARPHRYTRENPYLAEVLDRRPLTREASSKLTVHLSISLAGSEVHYEAGDACGVLAQNDPFVVDEILNRTHFSPDALVDLPKIGSTRLIEALTHHLQPTRLNRKIVSAYAALGDCCKLANLLSPEAQNELNAYMYDRGLIDLIEECPGLITDPSQLVALLPKLSTRLYSISSSPSYHAGELHTTIAVVRYRSHNRERGGVCSTMLSDRTPLGARIPMYIQPNRKFRLPQNNTAPIIMIGPGTGIAPFRSFLHERRALGATGRNWLFFGERSATTDFLYRDELEAMRADGHVTRLDTAFSRDQADKVYVQDRMVEAGEEFWRWLNFGASVYVCGDASRMAKDVDSALHTIIETHGNKSPDLAKEFVQELQDQGRYHRDVY